MADGLPILLLYIFDSFIWADPNYSERHLRFVKESLNDLNEQLRNLCTGGNPPQISIFQGKTVDIFTQINAIKNISKIFSHEETGLKITYDCDTVRIYNPVKQSQEHDTQGTFIKQWVPELRDCPEMFIHEPWKMTLMEQELYNFRLGGLGYPYPIINLEESTKLAKERIWGHRKKAEVKEGKANILKRLVIPRKDIIARVE